MGDALVILYWSFDVIKHERVMSNPFKILQALQMHVTPAGSRYGRCGAWDTTGRWICADNKATSLAYWEAS